MTPPPRSGVLRCSTGGIGRPVHGLGDGIEEVTQEVHASALIAGWAMTCLAIRLGLENFELACCPFKKIANIKFQP